MACARVRTSSTGSTDVEGSGGNVTFGGFGVLAPPESSPDPSPPPRSRRRVDAEGAVGWAGAVGRWSVGAAAGCEVPGPGRHAARALARPGAVAPPAARLGRGIGHDVVAVVMPLGTEV